MSDKPDEMRKEYDFSKGIRGRFYKLPEAQRLVPLDADIVAFFQKRAKLERRAYQTLINEALRDAMAQTSAHNLLIFLQELVAKQVDHALAQRDIRRSKNPQTKDKKSTSDLATRRLTSFDDE
jgi:uncharacterized protein (DUF4415 family)